MKRIVILSWFLIVCLQMMAAAGGFPFMLPEQKGERTDADIEYQSGDMTYVFGSDGEGLIKVRKNGVEIYDFGRRPAWFLLKYMLQERRNYRVETKPMYYYPKVGPDTDGRNYMGPPIVDPGPGQGFPGHLPPGVLYLYEFTELCNISNEKTIVALYFVIPNPPAEPFDGIMIYISVVNRAGEKGDQKYRLMEVHCPFVRLPKIGSTSSDDVTTIGNYLLDNPIETYKPKIEPYDFSVDHNGNPKEYLLQQGNYPGGFQVRAYYETAESTGKGIYMALYNVSREVCQNNLYKHQGSYQPYPYMPSWTDWIGPVENHPDPDFREYLVWDVVRYTTDINQNEFLNSYALDLYEEKMEPAKAGLSAPS